MIIDHQYAIGRYRENVGFARQCFVAAKVGELFELLLRIERMLNESESMLVQVANFACAGVRACVCFVRKLLVRKLGLGARAFKLYLH